MVYLIGGPPRCGKTTVAKQLAARLCCSRLPVDYLTTAFMGYVSPDDERRMFPREGVRGDARFAQFTAEQIVHNYRTKAQHTWPGLRSVIEYALYDGHTMVLEGYQIEPRFVAEFQHDYPQFAIKPVFLYRDDVATLREDLQQSTDTQDWVVRETHEAVTFTRIAEMVATYSTSICAEAVRYQLPCMNMGHTFLQRVDLVVVHLCAP